MEINRMQSPDKHKHPDKANTILAHETSEQKRARLEREHRRFSPLAPSELQNTSKQDNTSLHNTLEAEFEAALNQAQLEIERAPFSLSSYEKQCEMQRNIQKETRHEVLHSVDYIQSLLMLCTNDEDRKKVYHSKIESVISNAAERAKQKLGYSEKE